MTKNGSDFLMDVSQNALVDIHQQKIQPFLNFFQVGFKNIYAAIAEKILSLRVNSCDHS